MKRILFITLILAVFCSPCFGEMNAYIAGSTVASGDDDCTNLGSWDLYWDGDHADGFDDYCINGGTGQFTLSDAGIEQTAPSGKTGNAALINAEDEYMSFAPSGYWRSSQGVLKFDIYVTSLSSLQTVFEGRESAANEFYVQINATNGRVKFGREGGGTSDNVVNTTNVIAINEWTTVQVGWTVTDGDDTYVYVNSPTNGSGSTSGDLDVSAYSSEPSTVYFGESVYNAAGSFYIKNIYMSTSYEAAP